MNKSARALTALGWLCVFVFLVPDPVAASEERDEIVVGFRETITSSILDEMRTLEIYLPDNFADSNEKYPVLIVLDGGWYFRYVISIVDMMSPNYMPRMIVVGLPNTDRRRDLDPSASSGPAEVGGADTFLRFLSVELIPHLESRYRAQQYRVVTGHSLAGYFTIYGLLKTPVLFDAFIASSPSLRSPERLELLLGELGKAEADARTGKYFFFSAGGNEPEELHENHRAFGRALKKKSNGMTIRYEIFANEGHVPTRAFYTGIRGLFATWIPSPEFFRIGDVAAMKRHYRALTETYGFDVLPPAPIINSAGRRMLREGDVEGAAEVYEYFVLVYPQSVDAYLALAEIRVQMSQPDAAVANIKRALELEPGNQRAKEMLDGLL